MNIFPGNPSSEGSPSSHCSLARIDFVGCAKQGSEKFLQAGRSPALGLVLVEISWFWFVVLCMWQLLIITLGHVCTCQKFQF